MKVSVIIVNYNVKYFLEVCLDALYRSLKNFASEVFVVDNDSRDGSVEMLKQSFPQVRLIANNKNVGFGKANNQAYALACGEYVLFLNPDTVLPEEFFEKTLAYMDAHPKAGGIGPRLIDGKGRFAPDAKKSFPSFSVALFKATGINRLFPKSPFFNRYYAAHIPEHTIAPVDALSGCCMMMRRSAVEEAGGAFDQDYFMYFEDGDLCYRIREAGYENIYFPEITVIHYKGESTRKTTLSYVKIFNEAFAIFARKHYSRRYARVFILLINLGVVLRAFLSVFRTVLKLFRMPLFDALILLCTLWLLKEFWTEQVKNIPPIPMHSIYLTFPAYIIIWLLSMFLSGAYDTPYRSFRVVRGMLIGTVLCLAYFGLISPELRYSRAIIILTGILGSLMLVVFHEVLYRVGIFRRNAPGEMLRKALIVGSEESFTSTRDLLKKVHHPPEVFGRISNHPEQHSGLATTVGLNAVLSVTGADEVIFCMNDMRYTHMMELMQQCGPEYDYKIHLHDRSSFVGSNSSNTAGDLYTSDLRFSLANASQQRNKRLLDVTIAVCLLILSPLFIWIYRRPTSCLRNIWEVLIAQKTWVGYALQKHQDVALPALKSAVLPPCNLIAGFTPSRELLGRMDFMYALDYSPVRDLQLIWNNRKFLDRQSGEENIKKILEK